MKKYLTHLLIFSLVLAAIAVTLKFTAGFTWLLPLSVAYFAVVTCLGHSFTTASMKKEPRVFVKNFLIISVSTMVLHLVAIFIYAITQMFAAEQAHDAKRFIIAFAILFVIYLLFETIELLIHVHRQKKLAQQEEPQQETEID